MPANGVGPTCLLILCVVLPNIPTFWHRKYRNSRKIKIKIHTIETLIIIKSYLKNINIIQMISIIYIFRSSKFRRILSFCHLLSSMDTASRYDTWHGNRMEAKISPEKVSYLLIFQRFGIHENKI